MSVLHQTVSSATKAASALRRQWPACGLPAIEAASKEARVDPRRAEPHRGGPAHFVSVHAIDDDVLVAGKVRCPRVDLTGVALLGSLDERVGLLEGACAAHVNHVRLRGILMRGAES